MKICVFSDIHGNGPAFQSALSRIISEKADFNMFLGDLCGYYYDQVKIFPHLQEIPNLIAIKGNHDSLFLDIYHGNNSARRNYIEQYGKSMEQLLQSECHELAAWLSNLPNSLIWKNEGLQICHGSPWSAGDEYIYPDTTLDRFEREGASIFFLGHTHYPMHRKVGNKIIINPGSLGQPRHGGWPSYALVELPSGNVEFREVRYDMAPLFCQIEEVMENNPYLKEVLKRIK
jgi:putative phosphoesterase